MSESIRLHAPGYVAFNRSELTTLNLLPPEDVVLYLQLKRLANFQTGVVGAFGNQKLSHARLAGMISRPALPGLPGRTFNGPEVAIMLGRLASFGLVAEMREENGRLLLHLPLSAQRKAADGGTAKAAQPPDGIDSAPPVPLSILIRTDEVLTGPSEPTGIFRDDGAERAGETARAANPFPEAPAAPTQPPTPNPLRTEPSCPGALAEAEIAARIIDCGRIAYAGHPEAVPYYSRWAQAGLTREQLNAAIGALMEDFSSEVDVRGLDQLLRKQVFRKAKKKGGLVL